MNKIRQQTTDNRQQTLSVSIKKLMAHGSWLIALIFIISSCSTHRETTNLRNLSANHIIREVEDNRFEFDNLEAKFDVKFKDKYDGGNIGLKGQLRMQNDSVIWISISLKLGIEVARVMITEDTVKFINKTKKTYYAVGLEGLDTVVSIEKPLLYIQNLLVGNDNNIKDEKYKVFTEDGRYLLKSMKENEEEIQIKNIYIKPETFKMSKYEIVNRIPRNGTDGEVWYSTLTMKFAYENFQDINGSLIPSRIIFEESSLSGEIEIDYTEIKVGEKLEFPFNISKKYEKINL